jgi:hypothetical protein
MDRHKRVYDFGASSKNYSVDDITNTLQTSHLTGSDDLGMELNMSTMTLDPEHLFTPSEVVNFLQNINPNTIYPDVIQKELHGQITTFKQYIKQSRPAVHIVRSIFISLSSLILYSSRSIGVDNYKKIPNSAIKDIFQSMFYIPPSSTRYPSSYTRKQIDKLILGVKLTTDLILSLELALIMLPINRTTHIDNAINLLEDIRLSYVNKVKVDVKRLNRVQAKVYYNYIAEWDDETGALQDMAEKIASRYGGSNQDFNITPYRRDAYTGPIKSESRRTYRSKPY